MGDQIEREGIAGAAVVFTSIAHTCSLIENCVIGISPAVKKCMVRCVVRNMTDMSIICMYVHVRGQVPGYAV